MHFPQVVPATAVSDQQNHLLPGFAHNATFLSAPESSFLQPLALCMVLMLVLAVIARALTFDMSLRPEDRS